MRGALRRLSAARQLPPRSSADGGQNEREWAVLCEQVLGQPDLVADERFATNPDR
jgi:crotonobetainyl-CoA:carnitine CoA-transferase CaiB-like acyl-CoA transferase